MWIASLSNGETIQETEWVKGEISPWQKLLKRIRDEDLKITGMRLFYKGRKIAAMSKAIGYVACYETTKNMMTGEQKIFQGIGSVYDGNVFMNWINVEGDIWQDIRPFESMKVHSTLS